LVTSIGQLTGSGKDRVRVAQVDVTQHRLARADHAQLWVSRTQQTSQTLAELLTRTDRAEADALIRIKLREFRSLTLHHQILLPLIHLRRGEQP
jgi:hypothetical protein